LFWRIYPLAIALGVAAGSGVLVLASTLGLLLFSSGDADVRSVVIAEHSGFQIVSLLGSVASPFAAGWVAAQFALGEELINASFTGMLLAAFGVAGYLGPQIDDLRSWVDLLAFGLALPLSAIGGLLYRGRTSSA
jgi:hypothetical protein